jgi:hypothetical protein
MTDAVQDPNGEWVAFNGVTWSRGLTRRSAINQAEAWIRLRATLTNTNDTKENHSCS